jgi:predicted nucleic-acid-binding protein
MKLIDANVILRFLLNDNPKLSNLAVKIIEENKVILLTEVLAEVVYVLRGVYKVPRQEITEILLELGSIENITFSDRIIAECALKIFSSENIDFIDCVLLAFHVSYDEDVVTFDKKLRSKLARNLINSEA